MPEFDPAVAPDDPVTLFLRWLEVAIRDGVRAPHAMTLATADDQGQPSSRVLICKDVDGTGRWYFASSAASGKGRDLAVNPRAALSFWWPQQGRQIRIRGPAGPADRPDRAPAGPGSCSGPDRPRAAPAPPARPPRRPLRARSAASS
jgi:pyridoxamine 5'-phosphate oxidase